MEEVAVEETVVEYLRTHGAQPRHRSNRLLFIAADHSVLSRLKDATCVVLAWASIVDSAERKELTIDLNQLSQARKELESANAVLPAARYGFPYLWSSLASLLSYMEGIFLSQKKEVN